MDKSGGVLYLVNEKFLRSRKNFASTESIYDGKHHSRNESLEKPGYELTGGASKDLSAAREKCAILLVFMVLRQAHKCQLRLKRITEFRKRAGPKLRDPAS